jgi:putative ABC transport system permease protein
VARGSDGRPQASREIVLVANLARRADATPTNVAIRGVTPRAFQVRSDVAVTQGRRFQPGLEEVIVGRRIAARIRGLDVGSSVRIQRRDWRIVGIFGSGGSSFESEIWADASVMGPAIQREGGSSSLVVRLADAAALPEFSRAVRTNPQLQLRAFREVEYYADQAGPVGAALLALAGFVSLVLGVGAVFGAANTMHAVVASRTREIGTLRALGFPPAAVVAGFLVESALLALAGGLLGCLLAFPAQGLSAAAQGPSYSELAFAFRITPRILFAAVMAACVMGIAGGLLPALRAARLPIASAVREE